MNEDDAVLISARAAVSALDKNTQENLKFMLMSKKAFAKYINGWYQGTRKGRVCKICGEIFNARSSNQIYCCQECKRIGNSITGGEVYGKEKRYTQEVFLQLPEDVRKRLIKMLKEVGL